ncbi:MAG: hypothetical protein Q8R10_13565 [Pseudomonas sp.]|uniref:hypothetical protein n=1 Tax=Pseudomonas sp. TaxID=306 RepID=UPI002736073A|nr:hypothetical protein [Pseudomonas sp.]MDP3847439.1 hypothetical protein [Pseudomonas sp.]
MWRVGLLALLLLLSLRALAVESLTWALMPIPGAINVRDDQPQDGIIFELLQQLDAQLSDVAVQYQIINAPRILHYMARGRNLCSAPYQRSPERDQIGYFVPLLLSQPIQVVVRATDAQRLPLINGQLWLDELLASDLRGGFFMQRVYPPKLQARLSEGLQQKQLIGVNEATNSDRLLLMLGHSRFDYTFEFPISVVGFARANPQAAPLRTVPLADLEQMPVFGSYCTRNAWGREMAARIDNAVRALLADPQQVQALYQRWLPVESYQTYQPEIQEFLRQRAQQSLSFPAP